MNPIGWLRARADQRRADLDARVLAELTRLGSAHELEVRHVVRTQHALLHASFLRLEQAGVIAAREEAGPGSQTRRVYFVAPG